MIAPKINILKYCMIECRTQNPNKIPRWSLLRISHQILGLGNRKKYVVLYIHPKIIDAGMIQPSK